LSEPVNLSTFTDSALALTRDGAAVPLNSSVTVALVSGSTYRVRGLGPFTSASSRYALAVNASSLSDAAGNPGTGTLTTNWGSRLGTEKFVR
jgi:hypothetical protein